MFDLPINSSDEKTYYTLFRKNILKLGYFMIQYSIYTKVISSKTMVEQHINKLKKIIPPWGSIRAIVLTEKQYNDMYVLSGNKR